MKKGERFRIAIEAGVVLLLAVGVFRFYQVKQQQKPRDKEAPTLNNDRGLGKLIKMRADESATRPEPVSTRTESAGQVELDLSEDRSLTLPEPALLVIQIVDSARGAFLEPVTVYSQDGGFTNQVNSGRLALSLSAMTLTVGGQWDALPALKIEPAQVRLEAGKTTGVVLVVDAGVLPGFDLVRDSDLLIVSRVDAGSPAALAGLQIDDIVVEVAGIPVEQIDDAALLGVLESSLLEPLALTIAEPAGEGWTAVSVILEP